METTTIRQMDTGFFITSDRNKQPYIVTTNKVPMGLYIPCNFDEEGNPNVEQVCKQLRELESQKDE